MLKLMIMRRFGRWNLILCLLTMMTMMMTMASVLVGYRWSRDKTCFIYPLLLACLPLTYLTLYIQHTVRVHVLYLCRYSTRTLAYML